MESAAAQLKSMEEPLVADGQLTLVGLSCTLCAPNNSAP